MAPRRPEKSVEPRALSLEKEGRGFTSHYSALIAQPYLFSSDQL
jgi:hypothetical protein